MKLNRRVLGDGPPLIIMHGVFGSSDNWQTVGKMFAETHRVYLPDLRNHGLSPHSEAFTYELMVEDIIELMDDEHLDQAYMIGHSMGGKVAMHLATTHPSRVVKPVIVDIAPKNYPPHHQQIFDGFHAVDLAAITSRKEADAQLSQVIKNQGIRQFILKNLTRDGDGRFQWKLHIDALERAVEEVGRGPQKEVTYDGEALFIAGGSSDYILPDDHALIKSHFPHAKIASIAGAGHWVHAEKPEALFQLVLQFIS